MSFYDIDEGGTYWLYKQASSHYWRVKHIYDQMEDLTQDGFLCWYICANRYQEVTDYKHLMSLFKTTFRNHIFQLAAKGKDRDYNYIEVSLSMLATSDNPEQSDAWILDNIMTTNASVASHMTSCNVDFGKVVADAPDPVDRVLALLLSDQGAKLLRRPFRRRLDGTRETMNDRLRRYVDGAQGVDLLHLTKTYLVDNIGEHSYA